MTDLPMTEAAPAPNGQGAAAAQGSAATRRLFLVTILLGSFLLFLVQPMIARMALPRLGGAPAVWNSAMLVYQALLLGGYAYSHALGRITVARQVVVHLAVLALAAIWLPIGLARIDPAGAGEPVLWVPLFLLASIGPLFFAVSAQAPLMQRWFSVASGGADPYALYAASNAGSFAGLLAYPLLVEPALALSAQSRLWSAGYLLLIVLVLACGWRARAAPMASAPPPARDVAEGAEHPPTRRRILMWIALATVPSGLMLATSTFLTTDIVAVPLLWVLPLGLYLLSFTAAFADRRGVADAITKFAPVVVLIFGGLMIGGSTSQPFLNALMALSVLFAVAVALHTRLYDLRPGPRGLTGFYLAMSVGGALGGVFAALIAPIIFDWTYEYPLLIIAAGALVPQSWLIDPVARLWQGSRRAVALRTAFVALLVTGVVAGGLWWSEGMAGGPEAGLPFVALTVIGVLTVGTRIPFLIVLTGSLLLFGGFQSLWLSWQGDIRTRSYFGVYTVEQDGFRRQLSHGTTLHGIQLTGSADRERWPTSYYLPRSGVGRALLAAPELYGREARIGVVGLGAGTLACFARPGQHWRFFEIDPAVVRLARDDGRFTFLSRCQPSAQITLGDARLSLEATRTASLDLLVLDAFSSDAVPMHLMTRQAFATYARVLPRRGALLVHISNRYLALAPVITATAAGGDWYAARLIHRPGAEEEAGAVSDWIVLTRDPETLATLMAEGPWEPLANRKRVQAWTDDYASILPVLLALHPDMNR
ncbi:MULTISPECIES: fused MFS/spermidine synthase [unclassified Sphingomonas]|uniref:fused MFS/spermidine synthase n=1 Tax=unclassified Sphingomonas TaxID=196159 RepID=UPI000A53927A|nr:MULTISPECIES: fused MFS/spermidine synthase [unclassified Sphingomonas]